MSEKKEIPESNPERMLWLNVIYQALSDLEKPERWSYLPINQRFYVNGKLTLDNPYENDTWRSAAQVLLSGREDNHMMWGAADIDPRDFREQVLTSMKRGTKIAGQGGRLLPSYDIDFRRARVNVLRGYHWAKRKFQRPLHALYAADCHRLILELDQ